MSLYRIGKVWYVDLPSVAGRIRRSTGTTDKAQATQFHNELEKRIWRQEKLGENPPITWGEAVSKWLDEKPRGLPDRYRLGALKIDPSTPLPLAASAFADVEAGAPATWNRLLSIVIAIHNACGVTPPPLKKKKPAAGRTRWLKPAEWQKLHQALEHESALLAQIAEFALATGLRENNVLNLEWADVDLKARRAVIHAPDMKQRVDLGVPLNDAACAILRARKGHDKQYVFAHPDSGKPLYKASNRAWYAAVKAAGLVGFRFHDLRHTWASWHVQAGTRIEQLQELGGWKTLQMVNRYKHFATEHLAEVAGNVSENLRYNKAPRSVSRQRNVKKGG